MKYCKRKQIPNSGLIFSFILVLMDGYTQQKLINVLEATSNLKYLLNSNDTSSESDTFPCSNDHTIDLPENRNGNGISIQRINQQHYEKNIRDTFI